MNLLGSRSIINLINAQSIKGEMNDDTIVTLNRFWDTAQDVAMTCLTLAKRIGAQAGDEAYALGLFHEALVNRGFLGLGMKESLHFSRHAAHFRELCPAEKIFQRA